jgi:hypothetical protein
MQYLLGRRDCVAHTLGFKEIRIFTRDVDTGNESWANLNTLMEIEPRTAVSKLSVQSRCQVPTKFCSLAGDDILLAAQSSSPET